MAKHNEVGKLGESIAAEYLEKKGFSIIDRNYNKKWGEIDIVTHENKLVHFVEVKSKSCSLFSCENKTGDRDNVSYETQDEFRPEEMLHSRKIQRLKRVIQTYILEKKVEDWQFDVIIVYIDRNKRIGRCKYLEDIIL